MAVISKDGAPANHLDAFDPGLSFLASQAAVALDNLLLGKPSEMQAVKLLGARLAHSTEEIEGGEGRRSLMDPATISVFSNAIAASGIRPIHTLPELAFEAWRLAEDLQKSQSTSEKHRLELLRTFCSHLANSVLAHEQSNFDTQFSDDNWS
jgi:hypothetical protein